MFVSDPTHNQVPAWISDPKEFLGSMNILGLPMMLWQASQDILVCNESFAGMLGESMFDWQFCTMQHFCSRVHPDEREDLDAVVQSVSRATLEERSYELRLGHNAGKWISVSLSFKVLATAGGGKASYLLFTLMDVSASRATRARWRTRAELASDWFWETNASGQITFMTDAVANALNIDLSHPESARFNHGDEVTAVLNGNLKFSRLKFRVAKQDSVSWFEIDGRPVFDARGSCTGFEGVGRDVSQREQMSQDVQSTVATLNAIVESIPIPLVIKDISLAYKKSNEPFRKLLGVTDEELIGQRAESMYDAEYIELHQAEDYRVLKTKVALKYEVQQHFLEHGVIDVVVQKAPILDSQRNVLGIIGMVFDVTSERETERNLRRAKEEAESASQSKSLFLATMSHEIRTPMNGVLGMAEMLSKDELNDDQSEAVGIIRQSASNLLTLIDDILDFSKIDSGKVEIDDIEVDVTQVVSSIIENLTPLSLSKSVRLRSFIGQGVPAKIRGDETRLRQILTNLVGNAIKFSGGRGEIRGNVYLRVTCCDGETIRFDVIDNGIGISAENLPKMFNAFTQAERSTTRRYGGTGLGLAISHKLASMLGGGLEVKSEPGIGSEFSLKIPMREAQGDCLSQLLSLDSITCILLESKGVPDNDLGLAIRVAGANVRRAKTIEHAQELIGQVSGRSVVISSLNERNEREVSRDLVSKSWPELTYHLLLTEGLRKSLRMLAEKVACIDIGRIETVIKAIHLLTSSASGLVVSPAVSARRAASPAVLSFESPQVSPAVRVVPGTRVLVAEDDPINQRVIARQLKSLGVEVDLAGNGRIALDMWRERKNYHAIITDMHMPEMDGYALASSIRSEEQADERIPILALTANAINGESFEAFQAGIDVYLTKPILLQDLERALAVYSKNSSVYMPGDEVPDGVENKTMAHEAESALVFDKERFGELIGHDEDIMLDLLDCFFDDGAKLVDEISVHLYGNEHDKVKALAHRLKSGSRSVGATVLGNLAAQIESQADKLLIGESQAFAVNVQREFERFLRAVKSESFGQLV